MDKISNFINEVHTIDVFTQRHYLVENMGYVKEDDVPQEAKKHLKSKMLYVVNKSSNNTIRTLYNKAKLSLAHLSNEQLNKTLTLLQDYSYKHFDKAYKKYYMKLSKEVAQPKHDTYFMLALQDRFKSDVPDYGVFTMEFMHDLMDDVGNKRGYMYSLTRDVKKLLVVNDGDITLEELSTTEELQSMSTKPDTKTEDTIEVVAERPNDSNTKKTPQLKTLFNFIDFLHANIERFNQYDSAISELKKKIERHSQLGFHYTEKSERDALQEVINEELDVILKNIIKPIKEKVAELELFNWELPRTFSVNYFELANRLCKSNDKDLDAILKAKTQYIEFTNKISPRVIQQAEKVFEYLYETMIEIAINFTEEGDVPIKYKKVKRDESFEELVKGFKKREKLSKPYLPSTAATIDSQSAPIASIFETDFSETNTIELINTDTIIDINFERVFAIALTYADDSTEMREFCIREQKKADRDYFYKKDHFYKNLLKVVVRVKEQVKFNQKPHPERKHVGSFFIAGGGGSPYKYGSVVLLEQIVNELLCEDKIPQEELANIENRVENIETQSSHVSDIASYDSINEAMPIEITTSPPSFDIPLTRDELEKHFNELVKTSNRILHRNTDFHHFCYAFSGHIIPNDKLPYKAIELIDYNNRFYYYLNDEIVQAQLKRPQKCLPNQYRKKAQELFNNKNGKPLKLSNPT